MRQQGLTFTARMSVQGFHGVIASAVPHQVELAVGLFVSRLSVRGRNVVSKSFEVDGVNAVGRLRLTEKHPFREKVGKAWCLELFVNISSPFQNIAGAANLAPLKFRCQIRK